MNERLQAFGDTRRESRFDGCGFLFAERVNDDGEKDNRDRENESGKGRSQSEQKGEKASPLMRLVIGWKGNRLTFVAPLKHQKPDGQQEQQEHEWMSEKHDRSGTIRGEKLVEIFGAEIGIGGVEPLFQL